MSGNPLKLVGKATLFAYLANFSGKAKQVTGLVLRGNTLDKEILLSRDQLIKWRMLHCGFPTQTIDDFVKDVLKSKIKVIKNYPNIKTTEQFERVVPLPDLSFVSSLSSLGYGPWPKPRT